MADLSPLEWLLLQVNKPVSALAGATLASRKGLNPLDAAMENLAGNRQDSFGDVLVNEGVSPTSARVGGFGLDVALDPLNLVPIGKAAKLVGLNKVATALRNTPPLRAVESLLNPTFDLPETYAKSRRLLNSSLTNSRGNAVEEAVKRFKGISLDERRLASEAMENPAALDAIKDPTRKQLVGDVVGKQKGAFGEMASREVAAGVLQPEQVKGILEQHGGYVPYVFNDTATLQDVLRKPVRNISGKLKFAKERSLDSFATAKALGAETDLAKLSAVRQAGGERAIHVNTFLDEVFKNPEWAMKIPETGFKPSEFPGWRAINTGTENPALRGKLATYAVTPEIADDIERLLSPKQVSSFAKGWDKVTNVWKNVATTMKPGFHARNAVSNGFNSWLGGMSPAAMPKRYAEAFAIIGGKIPPKIGAYSGAELVGKMKQYGVMGGEFGFVGDLGDSAAEALDGLAPSMARKVTNVATLGAAPALRGWAKAGRAVGSKVEDNARVALFLDQVRKGATAEDAALHVKKYLFDYQELTSTERTVLRRVVPFYTWLRKNAPLQLEHFIHDTGKYSNVASAYKETEGLAKDKGIAVPRIDRPDFLGKLGAVQMPFLSKSGEKEFFNPNLPFQDLGKIVPTGENLQDQLASLHPVFKAIIERGTNQSIFKDRPLYKNSPSELVPAPMSAQLFAQTFPDLAKTLQMKMLKQKGEAKWMMPEWAAYTLEQLPVFSTLGKASVNVGDPSTAAPLPLPEGLDGAVPEKVMRPPFLDFAVGTKFLPQSDKQLKRDKTYRKQDAMRVKKAKSKEDRATMSDEEMRKILP